MLTSETKLATLHELKTIYDITDLYDMLEILDADQAMKRLVDIRVKAKVERDKQNAESKARKGR